MNPRGKVKPVIWVIICAAGAFFALVAILHSVSREPSYQGKSLSDWLGDVGRGPGKTAEAEQAIRAIGSRALPRLLKMIKSKDSAAKRRALDLAAKQGLVDVHSKGWVHAGQGRVLPQSPPLLAVELMSAEERRDKAAFAMTVLGRTAASAIPELTKLLSDPEILPQAVKALSGVGPEAIPVLAPLATNSDAEIRVLVNKAFCFKFARGPEAKAHAAQVVPILMRNLRDEDYMIRADAAGGFDEVGDPAVVIPVLMPNLRDTNALVRAMTVQALGSFGSQSKATVPALVELTRDPDAFVRERAIWAVRQIEPKAIENEFPKEKD